MFVRELLEIAWRGLTFGKPAAVLGLMLVAAVAVREAPLVRGLPPVPTLSAGRALIRHGRIIRVGPLRLTTLASTSVVGAGGEVFEVEMTAVVPDDWQLAPADVFLEFADGPPIPAIPPDLADRSTSLVFAPGAERTARLRFRVPAGIAESGWPTSLRLRRPRTRFMLERG